MNFYQEEKRKREEWVATLKVGDEVAIRSGRFSYQNWHIFKVIKVTPTGRVNLDNGFIANPDGSLRGDSYTYINPVTNDIKAEITRKNAVIKLKRELEIDKLSNKHLSQLLQILKEHKEKQDVFTK